MSKKVVYLSRESFDLEKFKIEKDELNVQFTELRQGDEGTVKIPVSMRPPYTPHPDLLNVLSKLKVYVAKQYDYHKPLELSVTGKSKERLEEAFDELLKKITVTGFTVTGSDQLKSAIITAKIKTDSGTRALPTGRIVYSSDKLGYEQEVQQFVELATDEVYDCLFDGKRAQLDLFREDDGVKQLQVKGELVSEAS